jgi:membrane fusion protein, heavy metal efflux system
MRALATLLAFGILPACARDHSHEHAPEEGPAERPDESVTRYEDGLELFMEYPAFVVGQPSPLVAHLTDVKDPNGFRPVTKGRVTAVLRHETGEERRAIAERPLRDGIFKPEVTPAKAGRAALTLILEGDQTSGTVHAGEVVVHPSLEAAIASAPAEQPRERTFPFFKEQQWKTEYATAAVEARVLRAGVRANGEIRPVAGQAAELAAPVPGRILVGEGVPFLGQPVKKGQLLLRLVPTAGASATDFAAIDLESSRAKAELGLAERELDRAKEMLAAKAIPEKQLDTARVTRDLARARVEAAERQKALFRSTQTGASPAAGAAFELRSPLDGVVSFADVTPGAVVEAGARLVSVVNSEKLWLEAKVYEPEAPLIERSPGAAFTVAGFEQEFTIDEQSGRRVAVGAVVDRATRTVPIIFELVNPGGVLKPGMFAKVTLFTGRTVRALAVPESAVIDENGKPTVFVMEGGESFFKRSLKTGIRSGGWIEVLEGVAEGDRVVSRGAYEIKLATSSGKMPEHGHAH